MRARGPLNAAQSLGVAPRSVAARHFVRGDRIGLRIERPQVALADIDAPDLAVRIQRRVPFVGRDVVVNVAVVLPPGPLGDHHVALDAGRPRRRGRHLTGGDAGVPVGEALAQDLLAEPFGRRLHAGALPHGVPVLGSIEQAASCPVPSGGTACIRASSGRPSARVPGSVAPPRPLPRPRSSACDSGRGCSSLRVDQREDAGRRRLIQRQPVVGGIDLGRFLRRPRVLHLQREALAAAEP